MRFDKKVTKKGEVALHYYNSFLATPNVNGLCSINQVFLRLFDKKSRFDYYYFIEKTFIEKFPYLSLMMICLIID